MFNIDLDWGDLSQRRIEPAWNNLHSTACKLSSINKIMLSTKRVWEFVARCEAVGDWSKRETISLQGKMEHPAFFSWKGTAR